ncbi:MAG: S1 RNA-binding domain-containing protein [Desulfitobacterium hafniense]|nr:S1 RNA-binding domain-containing protein [Desulfitobacterium hafniense]
MKGWEQIYAHHSNGTPHRVQFAGIETILDAGEEYPCLVVYLGKDGDQDIKGYLPPSELGIEDASMDDLLFMLKYPIPVVISKIVRESNIVVYSRNIALNRMKKILWENIEVGQVLEGYLLTKVHANKTAYVDVGGAVIMVPPGEITWINNIVYYDLQKILPQFETVKVMIIEANSEKQTITGSLKATQKDPWQNEYQEKFAPGSIHTGIVTSELPTGVFVKLESGLTCLCPRRGFIQNKIPHKIGDTVIIKINKVDVERRRISGKAVSDQVIDVQDNVLNYFETAAASG